MNIYEKLCDARIALQGLNLKKSGNRNGMSYYELSDFLPEINAICKEKGIATIVSFTQASAKLTMVNTEKPEERIEFESPFGSAELRGCHAVQNIGAVETYQRRYLYMVAFEIVESDVLDGQLGEKEPQKVKQVSEKPKVCPVCGKIPEDFETEDGKIIKGADFLAKYKKCQECYWKERGDES